VYGNNKGPAAANTGEYIGAAVGQMQAEGIKKMTQLEQHLHALKGLTESLAGAVTRAGVLADRLLGQEPTNNLQGGDCPPKEPMRPVTIEMEAEARGIAQLIETVHFQLNRLERL